MAEKEAVRAKKQPVFSTQGGLFKAAGWRPGLPRARRRADRVGPGVISKAQ